ncbi:endo-1,4-beta-xylanase [Oerskovia sp. M15]
MAQPDSGVVLPGRGRTALTSSAADQQVLKDRMRTHIFSVAGYLSDTYGKFGSPTNPLTAFDVVNEVVSDGAENADGLRRSPWFTVLGEQYIDLAFQYADEAFNTTYAEPGRTGPSPSSSTTTTRSRAGSRSGCTTWCPGCSSAAYRWTAWGTSSTSACPPRCRRSRPRSWRSRTCRSPRRSPSWTSRRGPRSPRPASPIRATSSATCSGSCATTRTASTRSPSGV